jgi:hypothetical protein
MIGGQYNMKILESVNAKIEKCKEAFSQISVSAQKYIDKHNEYIEGKVEDSLFIKEKMKDKIARVIDK